MENGRVSSVLGIKMPKENASQLSLPTFEVVMILTAVISATVNT